MVAALKYRSDIDGLRAISIVAVLGYHAGVSWFPGGFVGVDIFFVISGFLITGLLVAQYSESGRINLLEFWARRMRRLAPALLLVLSTVLLLSVVLLQRISGEIGALAKAAIYTLLLSSNHFFLLRAGDYFGAAAETNPLLHMWSLSGEEQFYLAWPIVLVFLLRRSAMARSLAVAAGLLGSLLTSCFWGFSAEPAGFYLMVSRAWELLAGAALAFALAGRAPLSWCTRWVALVMASIGVLLVGATVACLPGPALFPGPLAVFPVSGTLLLILAGAAAPWNPISRLIGSTIMAYLGKISYPLYLWHWPLLVISRSRRLYEQDFLLDGVALLLSLVLAVLTYEMVERRSWRALKRIQYAKTVALGAGGTVVVLLLAVLVGAWARYGWGYSERELMLDAVRKDRPSLDCMFQETFPEPRAFNRCFPLKEGPAVLLWGDSHANQWRPAFGAASKRAGVNMAVLTMNACRPLPGPVGTDGCVKFNEEILRSLPEWKRTRNLAAIVIAARWPEGTGTVGPSVFERPDQAKAGFYDRRATSQKEALDYLGQELTSVIDVADSVGLRVLVILASPVQRFAASHCLAVRSEDRCFVDLETIVRYSSPSEKVIRRVSAGRGHVRIIDPKAFMCRDGKCPTVLDQTVVYSDDDHVSRQFALAQKQRFAGYLEWAVGGASRSTTNRK